MLEEGAVYNLPVLPLDGGCSVAAARALFTPAFVAACSALLHGTLLASCDCVLDAGGTDTHLHALLGLSLSTVSPPKFAAGLVLCPGNTLPLRLTFRGDRALVQQALSAPPPLSRLIAVVCCTRSYFTPQLMLQR